MGQNKEQLRKLLDFIEALSIEKGNEWFEDELRRKFNSNDLNLDSFLRLNREKQRKKARKYYEKISHSQLRNQLIDDHANMLWYKSIFEIERFFLYVNFQIENMLNYYIDNTDAHNKVQKNPKFYYKELSYMEYKVSVDSFSYFFNKYNGNKNPTGKISSLWAKLVYWAVDSDKIDFLENQFTNFSAIINIRNDQSHANYSTESKSAVYWKQQEDDYNFAFIYAIIKIIRNTII